MKKIIFLFTFLACTFSYSQIVLEDFEGDPPTVTENNGLGSFDIIADPTGEGKGNVLEVISAAAGAPWQQANLIFQDDKLDLSSDPVVSVEIYSDTAINILSRTEDPGVVGHSTAEAQHNGTGWETLDFNFTGNPDGGGVPGAGPYTQISFFPSWAGGGTGDNIDNANWFNPVDGKTFLVNTVTGVAAVVAGPTCTDGIQNGDETGVDCGGSCPNTCPTGTEFPIDFETSTTWGDFDGGEVTTIPNPQSNSDNNSANVGQMVKNAGATWAGSSLLFNTPIDFANNNTFTMKAYTVKANTNVLLKVENSGNPAGIQFEQEVTMTTTNAWETLTFDYSGIDDRDYDKLVIIFDNGTQGDGSSNFTFYIDDIELFLDSGPTCTDGLQNGDETGIDCGGSCDPCTLPNVPPTEGPTDPPARNAADVISIYGDFYPSPVGLNNVPWDSPSEFTEIIVGTDNVLKIDYGVFLGTDLGSVVDATNMTHFHMDFWVADAWVAGQVFNPKWSNHTGAAGETDAGLVTLALPGDSSQNQTWVSLDVELLSTDDGGLWANAKGLGIDAREALTQFLLDPGGSISEAYVDNIYFYKEPTASVKDAALSKFKVFPNPTRDEWNIKSQDSNITSITIYNVLGKEVLTLAPNKTDVFIDGSSLNEGLYFAKVATDTQSESIKLIKK